MKFHASNIQLSPSGGEYFQISLSESDVEHCPYVLLQNSFEFFRGPAYFECHDLDLSGHGRIIRCEFQQTSRGALNLLCLRFSLPGDSFRSACHPSSLDLSGNTYLDDWIDTAYFNAPIAGQCKPVLAANLRVQPLSGGLHLLFSQLASSPTNC